MTDREGNGDQPPGRVPGQQPTDPPRAPRETGEPDAPLGVYVEPRNVRIEPGGTGTFNLRVRNTGTVVDEITIGLAGEAATWGTVVPASLRLFPGTEGQAVISLELPRASYPPAGARELQIVVSSKSRAAASVEERVRFEISPFDELTATLEPRFGLTKREFTSAIRVANQGNRPIAPTISASDPHHALDLSVNPPQLSVAAGSESMAWLRARPRRSIWFGHHRTYPFEVAIRPPTGPQRTLDGRLEQLPLFPRWVGALALLAAGLAIIFGVTQCLAGGGPGATPTPTVTVAPFTTPPGQITTRPGETTPPAGLKSVPNVVGRPLNEAIVILQREGFNAFERPEPGPRDRTFEVTRTDPPAGQMVPPGSDILVFFIFGQ